MINIDTDKIVQCGNDLIKLSQDLNIIIQDMYAKINKVIVSNTWVGESALEFVNKANQDKIQILNFQKNLYNYGLTLKNNSQRYDQDTYNIRSY